MTTGTKKDKFYLQDLADLFLKEDLEFITKVKTPSALIAPEFVDCSGKSLPIKPEH